MRYIDEKIFGLPKPLKDGDNTRSKHNLPEYVHKVEIHGTTYFKVHIKRQDVSKIKYFKKKKEAELFVEMLRENKYF